MTRERPKVERPPWEPTGRDVDELAWTIVRRENRELRASHPKVYGWAKAHLDERRRGKT